MRIVSLVPNATEIVFALGAGDLLVGVSHECDFPPEAANRPILTGSVLAPDLAPAEIDAAVGAQLAGGGSLYTIDETRLRELAPDLVLTQSLCPVCAVSPEQVAGAVARLERCPEVLSLDPKTLAEVLDDIRRVGAALDRGDRAAALIAKLELRIDRIATLGSRAFDGSKPSVCALEWLDPPFVAGHWVPEQIALAGGVDAFAVPGDPSRKVTWEAIADADPDVLVAMPCGFDRAGAEAEVEAFASGPAAATWKTLRAVRQGRVYAVDANGCFSRPGPRLLDGTEFLAGVLRGRPAPLDGAAV